MIHLQKFLKKHCLVLVHALLIFAPFPSISFHFLMVHAKCYRVSKSISIVLGGWGNVVAWSFYMLMTPLFSQPQVTFVATAALGAAEAASGDSRWPCLPFLNKPTRLTRIVRVFFCKLLSPFNRRISPLTSHHPAGAIFQNK